MKLIEDLQVENEKTKESLKSLRTKKESNDEFIQALQTKKQEIFIEKQGIIKQLEIKIVSEHEKEKTIQTLREEITYLQLVLDKANEEGASKMKVMKRKIKELEASSKEESIARANKARFWFW